MHRDKPANIVRQARLLLLIAVVLLLTDHAYGDTVRVYSSAGSDGPDVTLAQVAELEGEHANQYARLVVGRFDGDAATLELDMNAIITAMKQDGARLGVIDFKGFGSCTVHRTFNKPRRAQPSPAEPAASNIDARGRGPVTVYTPTTVRSLIEHTVAEALGVAADSLDVSFSPRDEDTLKQSAVAGRFDVETQSPITLGRVAFRVQGYEGTQRKGPAKVIHAQVSQRVLAVIAAVPVSRGETITRRHVRLAEVLIDDQAQAYLQDTQLVTGQVADNPIQAGDIITSVDVNQPLAVKRRERVSVELDTGGIRITFNGIAHSEGAIGETVEIENQLTKQRLSATVLARGRVLAGSPIPTDTKIEEKQR